MNDAPISVVVPTRNEVERIARTLQRLREAAVREVLVVDGGSDDGTPEVAQRNADRVIASPPGRARQMNTGARAASGEVLFFLHADTLVPPGFSSAIARACADPAVVGGRFDVELDGPGIPLRVVSAMINFRSRWTRLSTGDQGLFVRREVFERLGGFPPLPLLEDLAFSVALKRTGGTIACLRERLRTSARRWQARGVTRTIVLMWWIRALYFVGVPPARLARLYRDVR